MKKNWDPELVFSCRHCIGDGKAAMNVMLALKIWLAKKNKKKIDFFFKTVLLP